MALTPEEQQQLDYLRERQQELDDEEQGQKAVTAFKATQPSPTPDEPQGHWYSMSALSPVRIIGGGIRNAVESAFDVTQDVINWAEKKTDFTGFLLGSDAPNGVIGIDTYEHHFGPNGPKTGNVLPDFAGSETASPLEKLLRGVVSFAVPFTAALKVTSGLRALPLIGRSVEALDAEAPAIREFTTLGKMVHGATAGAITDFSQEDPVGGNMANVLKETFGIDNAMLDSLASEPDDSRLLTRLKAAATGIPVGVLSDAVLELGARGLRAYRAWKGTMAQNQGIVDAFKAGPVKLTLEDADALSPKPKKVAVRGLKGKLGVVEIDPSKVTTMDDALAFLKEKAGSISTMSKDDLQRFAANLADGDPENALKRLGIDPAKLDFSVYRDPEMLGRLQDGLAHVYQSIAEATGRTGTRVTEKEIARGAESLASTPEVLRSLYRSTHGLAERIMAARMIAGAHAHKLLAQAREALAEIESGLPGDKWAAFMETFTEHGYLLGQLRGAGSEVGRALRSLQMQARVTKKKAGQLIEDAFKGDTAKGVGAEAPGAEPSTKMSIDEAATQYGKLLQTDAEKVRALKRLIDLEGDVAELSRTVREGGNTGLKRIGNALKEPLVGNLFTFLTATRNMIGSMGFLGVDAAGRYGAALARSALGIFSKAQRAEAARARWEAWAITEGILGGFRPAFRSMLGVIQREGLSEASINLDQLGFSQLAKKAEVGSLQAEGKIGQHYERADVVRAKNFAMSAAERRALEAKVDELSGPKFFKAGLKGLIRLTGTAINAAGTGFRFGTTLTINAPDEFVGTIATHAGAYQAAVRLASKEARLNGLAGKDFAAFVKARSQTLFGEGPKGWAADGELAGARHVMLRAGTEEAKMVLFQDELEMKFNRDFANFMARRGVVGTAIIPFVKTPLRILERTAIDLNPLGLLISHRLRQAIVAGGSQRDEALARMSLGMLGLVTGYQLAKDRGIVGYDGGYASSARAAGRPSYSLRIGDDVIAFNGFDPLATFLGIGADLYQYEDATQNDPDAPGNFGKMFSAALFAISANVLSKTWLTSLKNLTDLAGVTNGDDKGVRFQRWLKGYSNRLVPGAGIQKGAEALMDPYTREALTFNEGIWKSSIGASKLPIKRNILGRPVENSAGARLFALPENEMPQDPVMREFERLSFQAPVSSRQKGVKLNASQFSRFLELRGQVVQSGGYTMEQALKTVIESPEYKALPSDAARAQALKKTMEGYGSLAADALTREDHSFAQARLKNYIFEQANLKGWTPDQRDQVLSQQSQVLATWLQQHQ